MGVAVIPLDDPEHAMAELDWVLDGGFSAVWVPHRPCGDKSPGHIELDAFWARLAESGTPFLLHVGGAPLQLNKAWTNTGRAAVKDWMGGGENVRSKDAATLHQAPETFISALVMDGVLELHPGLRGAAVELGAGWVPELVRRLDWVTDIYGRVDHNLKAFTRKPSEQITQQLAFTPFVFEDVARLVEESNPDLYLFSSDYPHTEGGRDPIARFERSLSGAAASVKDKFYAENFLRLFPGAA
jgi:predicted TIM-barrel fold metal-dependent hydrolase